MATPGVTNQAGLQAPAPNRQTDTERVPDDPFEDVGHRVSRYSPIETIQFIRPPSLPGVEVMDVRNSERLYRMFHETYTVCTLVDTEHGGPEWAYRGRVHQSKPRSLMIIEPGEMHVTRRIPGPARHFSVLMVAPGAIERVACELGVGRVPHLARACADEPDLYFGFEALHASINSGGSALEQQSRLVGSLGLLLERCGETRSRPPHRLELKAVARTRDYIDAMYREEISLDRLAEEAGVSRFHLCRMFSRAVGLPPHAYQIQLRIARSRELLTGGVAPAHVAASVGFSDQSHLGRHFGRIVGVTPGRYARMTSRGG